MESAEAPLIRYVINTKIIRVREQFKAKWKFGFGGDCVFHETSLGWFVYLEGSYEALHVGKDKPNLSVGDNIRITIEKVEPNALPSQPPV